MTDTDTAAAQWVLPTTITPRPPTPREMLLSFREVLMAALDYAETLCATTMVPDEYQGRAKAGAIAILHGADLGLNPLQALQNVTGRYGTPTVRAKTMVALLRTRGYTVETIETGPDRVVVTAADVLTAASETSTWTIERAELAGYIPQIDPDTGEYAVDEQGDVIGNPLYLTHPESMLWARAASEACSRVAPEVLMGIGATLEEVTSGTGRTPRPTPPVEQPAPVRTAGLGAVIQQWVPPVQDEAADAQSEPEPAVPPMVTRVQQRKIARLLGELGRDESPAMVAELSRILGRPVTALPDITRDDGIAVLAHLEDELAAAAAEQTEGDDQ